MAVDFSQSSQVISLRLVSVRFLLTSLLALLALSSCSDTATSPTASSLPRVLVTLAPQKDLVAKIAGDTVFVQSLIPPGANPHVYEPTAREVLALPQADLWFRMGEPIETRFANLFASHQPHLMTVDTQEGLYLLPSSCGHSHHPEELLSVDTHTWLSPHLLAQQATRITDALSLAYPDQETFYRENLASLLDELGALDTEIRALFAAKPHLAILVSHPAFAYFCHDYGLHQLSVEKGEREPSIAELSALLEEVKVEHVQRVFLQEQYNNKPTQMIARALNLPTYVVDPYAEDVLANLKRMAYLFAGYDAPENL